MTGWDTGYVIEGAKGVAVASALPVPPCTFCGGAGTREIRDHENVLRVGKCRCRRLPDRIALYNAASVPAKLAGATMESFRVDLDGARVGWTAARAWLDRWPDGRGLILSGEPGRGKTHLACAILRELVFRHGVGCRFVEFTHLLSGLREGIDRGDGDATTLTPIVKVPLLFLDELGKGRKTEWELSIVDEIVTRRYNTGGKIVATSNYPARAPAVSRESSMPAVETLRDRLGERVFSRLSETADFAPVIGADYRVLPFRGGSVR